jgi:cytochrome c553
MVQAKKELKICFACHGAGGVSVLPTRPTIAGQKVDYVAQQLLAFKRSAAAAAAADVSADANNAGGASLVPVGRTDPIMSHMAENLNDSEIPYIAAAVSQLSCSGDVKEAEQQPASRNSPVMPQVGRRCAVCHGENGIGISPSVPNLAGQQQAYLRRQLLLIREIAWGAKPRKNESWRTHPIMERQAARLSIEDVDALAKYYAALDCHGLKAQ